MLGQYSHFFAACATASAGFTGLLLVALSIVNHDDHEAGTRERRTVLAGTAFFALIDIFFVSLTSSLGGVRLFATASLVMAGIGLLATSHFMPRARRAGNFVRGFPKRRINLAFACISAAGYSTQLILAAALLSDPQSPGLTRALVFMLVALFGSALARAWEVAGIGHRAPREGAPPSHPAESEVEVVPPPRHGREPGTRGRLAESAVPTGTSAPPPSMGARAASEGELPAVGRGAPERRAARRAGEASTPWPGLRGPASPTADEGACRRGG